MITFEKLTCLIAITLLSGAASVHAQWKTETFAITEGWTAIYPLVDASDVSLDVLLAAETDIEEVWRWNPDALDPIVLDVDPIGGDEWSVWKRGFPADSTMTKLMPNYGYLIKGAKKANSTFSIKGKAVMPEVGWRSDGLNLVGFPAATAPAPSIEDYLAPSELLAFDTSVYRYTGGAIKADSNPELVLNKSAEDLARGQAYWINTGRYSDYYGPVKVQVSLSSRGLSFGDEGATRQLVLTNRADQPQTVTLTPESSETDRGGTTLNPVPLLERVFDTGTQNFTFPPFDGPRTITLAPGETASKVIVLDRASLTGSPGDINASLLTVTDGGTSRIHIPVSATVSSLGGLWVGEAWINQVQNQLQQFERDSDGDYVYDNNGDRIPIDDTSDTSLHSTAQTFPIRLLVHLDGSGNARVLSNVYAGPIAPSGTFGLATAESLLDPGGLADAVRLTSVHFPLDLNLSLTGSFAPSGTLTGTVALPFDAAVNPFVHTYHPNHDNLDARFESALTAGAESYDISRALSLAFDADDSASPDPTWGATSITGTYSEVITGIHKNTLEVEGSFLLRRLSDLDALNTP